MRKPKQPVKNPKTQTSSNLKDFLDTYPRETLLAALSSFEGSTGWEVLKAYAAFTQREYEVTALDYAGQQDKTVPAAFASGYARGLEQLREDFITGLRRTILDQSQIIENPPPEE